MRFHAHILPTYYPDLNPPFDVYVQQLLEQIELAEELGFECFWFTEHHFVLYGGPVPNPAVIMCAAAARTSKIHLGCAVSILPLHHPVQLAEDYAMVDAISGGRLEYGIGRGNAPLDPQVYGIPREERFARFEEALDVIKGAWTNDRFTHHGQFWHVDSASVYPKPVQKPHPPIWAAAGAADSMQWAGSHGIHAMTVAHPFPPERARGTVPIYRQALADAGYDPNEHYVKIHLRVWVDEDGERARKVAEEAIVRYDTYSSQALGHGPAFDATYDFQGMLDQGRNVYGNPDDCIRCIENTRRNYDFDIFSATFNFGGTEHKETLRAMRLFAKEVMPAFRDDPVATATDG